MEKKNDILRRPLYLYSLPAEVLDTLTYTDVANSAASDTQPSLAPPSTTDGSEGSEGPEGPEESAGGPTCALCGLSFATAVDQRGHVKSDLHHYNLKQKMRGMAFVTEAEFERLVGSLEESLSGSDWSGSESESDDDSGLDGKPKSSTESEGSVLAALLKKQAVLAEKRRVATIAEGEVGDESGLVAKTNGRERNSAAATAASSIQPLIWFRSPLLPENTYFGVYRALFTPEELAARPPEEAMPAAIRSRQLAPVGGAAGPSGNAAATVSAAYTGRHVFLCMIGGGHFAAMVVALAPRKVRAGSVPMNREATVLAHKTFHRYTTRRKQGGSQSANDNAKGAAHSAGSSLRRYNEQALVEDVRALLLEWKALLDSAELLLVRASGTTNRRTLFGPYDGQVLQARDPRLRSFPFSTRRPTQNEMMRAFIELTRLKVREIVPAAVVVEGAGGGKPETSKAKTTTTKKPAARSEEDETALLHTAQLQALVRRSRVPALLAYLQANGLSAADLRFVPADAAQNHHAPTLLHLAAAQNAPALVTALLVRAGADPAVRNGDGRTPFELAGDRATRDAFRVARSELGDDVMPAAVWESAHVPAPLTRTEAEQRDAREKQEAARREAERRRAEEARLKAEAAAEAAGAGAKKRLSVIAGVTRSAQEIREAEARGLTPEQRQRLERERRARAAEARMQRMQQGG